MKDKELQSNVLTNYQNGDNPTKIYRDLNGGISLRTIERWCRMICRSGSNAVSSPPGYSRLTRIKENIQKVKYCLLQKKEHPLEDYRWNLMFLK